MKIKRKKALLLMAGLITLTLAACGNTANNSNADDYKADISDNVSSEDYEAGELPQGEIVVVTNGQQQFLPANMYMDFAYSESVNGSVLFADVPAISITAKMLDTDAGGQMKIAGAQEGSMPDTKLFGVSNTAALSEFSDGQRKIVSGHMYESANECIVSKDLADANKLSVGDIITFENITLNAKGDKVVYELKISGIYSDATNEYDYPYQIAYLNRRNEIITGMETLINADSDGSGLMVQAYYFLKDGILLSDYENELREKGLPSDYRVVKAE